MTKAFTSITTQVFGAHGGRITNGARNAVSKQLKIVTALEQLELMRANVARKAASEDIPASAEEKSLATWGTDIPDDLILDQKKLAEALKKEDERKKERKDERKRKYNVRYDDEVTAEDMEAYRMKKIHHDDPMKEFLH